MSITMDAAVSLNALSSSSAIGIIGFCAVDIQALEFEADMIGIYVSLYGLSCMADLSAEWLAAAVAIQPLDSTGEFGWVAMCEVLSPDAQADLLVGIMMQCGAQILALSSTVEMGWWIEGSYRLAISLAADVSLVMDGSVNIAALSMYSSLIQDIIASAAVSIKPMTCTGELVREFSAFCHVSIEALRAKASACETLAGAIHVVMKELHVSAQIVATFEAAGETGFSVGCSAFLDNGPPAETELTYEELNP